jgi:Ca2+/Na+ antiporter
VAIPPIPANARFQCDFGIGEAIGSFIIWLILIVVTLGLASFIAPYYVLSAIINQTWVIDENGRKLAQLRVNFTLAEIIGHAVIWVILAIVTLGLAIIVYYYMVTKKVLNRTELVGLAAGQEPATQPVASPTTAVQSTITRG